MSLRVSKSAHLFFERSWAKSTPVCFANEAGCLVYEKEAARPPSPKATAKQAEYNSALRGLVIRTIAPSNLWKKVGRTLRVSRRARSAARSERLALPNTSKVREHEATWFCALSPRIGSAQSKKPHPALEGIY